MHKIYLITNRITNKVYVGQTSKTIEKRFSQHCRATDNQILHNSMRKYGVDAFDIKLIELCDKDVADEREVYWIEHYGSLMPNGYNMTVGVNGTVGYKFSEEDRKNIGNALKNWWSQFSKEERREMRRQFIEMSKRPKTEEHKRKISEVRINNKIASGENNPFYGKKHSDETKRIISELRNRPVICIHSDGNTEEFISIRVAGEEFIKRGYKSGGHYICQCLRGNQKTAYGCTWKYKL